MDPYLLGLVLQAAPAVAICVVGLVAAVEGRPKHPKASVFASLGLLVVIGSKVGYVLFQLWMKNAALSGTSYAVMTARITITNYALTGLSAIGLGLITIAIFVDRTQYRANA